MGVRRSLITAMGMVNVAGTSITSLYFSEAVIRVCDAKHRLRMSILEGEARFFALRANPVKLMRI